MEILKVGDEISISGYKSIILSDDMNSNIAEFAQVNGLSVNDAQRILSNIPALQNFVNNLNSPDEEDDIVIVDSDIEERNSKTSSELEMSPLFAFDNVHNNIFSEKTIASNTEKTIANNTEKTIASNTEKTISANFVMQVDEDKVISEDEIIYAQPSSNNSNTLKNLLGIFGLDVDTQVSQLMYDKNGTLIGFILDNLTYTVLVHSNGQISDKRIVDENGEIVEVTQYRKDGSIYDTASKEFIETKNKLADLLWSFIGPNVYNVADTKEKFLNIIDIAIGKYRDYKIVDDDLTATIISYINSSNITTNKIDKQFELKTIASEQMTLLGHQLLDIMLAQDKNAGAKNENIVTEYKSIGGVNFKISYNKNSSETYSIDVLDDGTIEITGSDCTIDVMGVGETSNKIKINGNNLTVNSNNFTFGQIVNFAQSSRINGSHGDDNVENDTTALGTIVSGLSGDDFILNNAKDAQLLGNDDNDTIVNNAKGVTIDAGKGFDAINYLKGTATIISPEKIDIINEVNNTIFVPVVPPTPTPPPSDEWNYTRTFTVNGVTFTMYSNTEIPSEPPTSFYKNVLTINAQNCKIVINSTTEENSSIKLKGNAIQFETEVQLRAVFNEADNSSIKGSGEKDYLFNYADNVTVAGKDGNDVICNEGENVFISGGEGADFIQNRIDAINAKIVADRLDELQDLGKDTVSVEEVSEEMQQPDGEDVADDVELNPTLEILSSYINSANISKLNLSENEINKFIEKFDTTEAAANRLAQIDVIIENAPVDNKNFLKQIKNLMFNDILSFNNEILADAQMLVDAQKTSDPAAYIKSQMIKDGSNLTLTQLLNSTQAGDVVEKSGKLYVNDGEKIVQLDISAETYLELFPPIKRYLVEQNDYTDCFFIATAMLDYMENDIARAQLLQFFSEDANGNITITFPGVSDYPITFQNGELKNTDNRFTLTEVVTDKKGKQTEKDIVYSYQKNGEDTIIAKATSGTTYDMQETSGSLGLQMLEQAYALAKFAQLSNSTITSDDIDELGSALYYAAKDDKISAREASDVDMDKALTYYFYGGYSSDVYNDLSSDVILNGYLKFANQTKLQSIQTLAYVYSTMLAFPNVVCTALITGSKEITDEDYEKYNVIAGHQYSIEAVDTINKIVYVKNPWDSYKVTAFPYDKFTELFYGVLVAQV